MKTKRERAKPGELKKIECWCRYGQHKWYWRPSKGYRYQSEAEKRKPKYCPEHRLLGQGEKISKVKAAYAEMKLPESRRCTDCGEVKPEWAFYRVYGPPRKDGSRTERLYTYCRPCARKRSQRHRAFLLDGVGQRGSSSSAEAA